MISTDQITDRLLADEGEVLHAYSDSEGYLTIGVGRLIDERKSGGITLEESRYLLRNDIARRIGECESRFDWFAGLDTVRQQAIVCMAFQLGAGGVAKFKRAIAAIKIRDWITAELEFLDSHWAEQTPERCKLMAKIIRTGVWK